MAHSRSFLANQKVRNAIVGAENLLKEDRDTACNKSRAMGTAWGREKNWHIHDDQMFRHICDKNDKNLALLV